MLTHVTIDDVVAAGACRDGVLRVVDTLRRYETLYAVDAILPLLNPSQADWLRRAAGFFGFGYGDGDGYGFGYGNGDGDGNGYGNGYGDINGDGNAYGNGGGDGPDRQT